MSRVLSGQYRYQMSESRRLEQEHYDKQPATFMCAFCEWTFAGPVSKGREKALDHRTKKHPETLLVKRRKRSGRALSTFRYTSMDSESIKEIQADRAKRAFLNGVELSE